MASWTTEAYARSMQDLRELKSKAPLRDLLYRYIVETGKQGEFLEWLVKDMGLDEPMDLTRVDALIDSMSHTLASGQPASIKKTPANRSPQGFG